jgi:large subunit ribosomal protein L34
LTFWFQIGTLLISILSRIIIISRENTMSITYQPKKGKRKRRHGFLKRNRTKTGKAVLKKRRQKGRKKLTTV